MSTKTNKIYYDGKVGIGVNHPESTLHVRDPNSSSDHVSHDIIKLSKAGDVQGPKGSHAAIALSWYENPGTNHPRTRLDFKTTGKGTDNWSTPVTVMSLRDDGYVGIGTTNPSYKLDVQGGARVVNPSGCSLMLERDNDNSWLTFHDPGNAWYSMGLDVSDGRKFKLNSGGAVGGDNPNHFTMLSDGKIGIGKSDPAHTLDVNGTINAKEIRVNGQPLSSGGGGAAGTATGSGGDSYTVYGPNSGWNESLQVGGNGRVSDSMASVAVTNGNLHIDSKNNQHGLYLNHYSKGDVLVFGKLFLKSAATRGYGSFPYLLTDTGTGEVTKGNSDQRLKKNIASISGALDKITALRGVSYQWNELGLSQKTKGIEDRMRSESNSAEDNEKLWERERERIRKEQSGTFKGFIAQEMETVFPEWVSEDEDGYKTIDTSEVIPVMVEAIKAQQKKIENLEATVERLEKLVTQA